MGFTPGQAVTYRFKVDFRKNEYQYGPATFIKALKDSRAKILVRTPYGPQELNVNNESITAMQIEQRHQGGSSEQLFSGPDSLAYRPEPIQRQGLYGEADGEGDQGESEWDF